MEASGGVVGTGHEDEAERKHTLVPTSQQLLPLVTDGQLLAQSESVLHVGTHALVVPVSGLAVPESTTGVVPASGSVSGSSLVEVAQAAATAREKRRTRAGLACCMASEVYAGDWVGATSTELFFADVWSVFRAMSGPMKRLRQGYLFLRDRPFAIVLLLGALAFLPALSAPYLLDDYLQASMVRGTYPVPRNPLDLYNFINAADRGVLLDRGMLPWWSHPDLTIRFLRPLPSALLWLDHRLLGTHVFSLHLHSFAWWAAATFAAALLFREVFSRRVAGFATVVFGLAPCHVVPLAWLANREALVSLTFGFLALLAQVRFRAKPSLPRALLSAAAFALAFTGGEYTLGFAGYVLAMEVWDGERRALGTRALSAAPFAVPAIAYLAIRSALGCGAAGSGFYSDPIRDPVAYLQTAPRRLFTLLIEAWCSLDADTLTSDTPAWLLALMGGALLFAMFRGKKYLGATLDEPTRTHVTWLFWGSLLSLPPVLAVVPSPRLLGASMLGVAALSALVIERAWFAVAEDPEPRRRAFLGYAALALAFGHWVHAPVTSWLLGRKFRTSAENFGANAELLREKMQDPRNAQVVVVRGIGGAFFLPFALTPDGTPPKRWRMLSQAGHVLALREDAQTLLLLAPKNRSLFPGGHGNLFRNERDTIPAGATFDLPGIHVTVVDVNDAGPQRVRFVFDEPLESQTWLVEEYRGFRLTEPPEPGFGLPFPVE